MDNPSSSGSASSSTANFMSNLELKLAKKEKDFNKIAKRVGKKLFPKEKVSMFVPSSAGVAPTEPQPDNSISASNSTSSMDVLRINCDPTEGYGWMADDDQRQLGVQSVVRAQEVRMEMIRQRIRDEAEELNRCKADQRNLSDVIVDNYSVQLSTDVSLTQQKIRSLESSLQDLRTRFPQLVPPPRPPRRRSNIDGTEIWQCVRCASEMPVHSYRCTQCQLPRLCIDPREAQRCGCMHCCNALGSAPAKTLIGKD